MELTRPLADPVEQAEADEEHEVLHREAAQRWAVAVWEAGLFDHEAWPGFQGHLQQQEARIRDALASEHVPVESVPFLRGQLKGLQYVLGLPRAIRETRDRLGQEVAELQAGQDEEVEE